MILSEKQSQQLMQVLQDTLSKNVVGYLTTSSEYRTRLLNEILNQQSDTLVQAKDEASLRM